MFTAAEAGERNEISLIQFGTFHFDFDAPQLLISHLDCPVVGPGFRSASCVHTFTRAGGSVETKRFLLLRARMMI